MSTRSTSPSRYAAINRSAILRASAKLGRSLKPVNAVSGSSPRNVSDEAGRRPCFGGTRRLQDDPRWRDSIVFNEYFHGDNGAGLGASHQTGWTGLIADVIRRRHGAVRAPDGMSDLIGDV